LSRGGLRTAFLDGSKGRILVVLRTPDRASGRCVLVALPLADEMNKSRKMLTQVAVGLAEQGVASLLVDYFGTGDSAGEFSAVDWDACKRDLAAAAAWSAAQGWPVSGGLAVRLGCVLLGELAAAGEIALERTVFWQPVLAGSRWLDQFLRMRVAATMMEGTQKETVAELRNRLQSGETIEVAGYEISGRLAEQLVEAKLQPSPALGELHWMELVRSADAELPKPSTTLIQAAGAQGQHVQAYPVVGEPFWASTEIVCIPSLVETTVRVLSDLDV
jgi:exosortase A-associated hydrolase 2